MQQQNTHDEPCQRTLSLGAGKAIGSEGDCGWGRLGLSASSCQALPGKNTGPVLPVLGFFFF